VPLPAREDFQPMIKEI